MKKRVISLLLVLVMCLSLLPAEAFAEDGARADVSAGDVRLEGTTSLGTLLTRAIEDAQSGGDGSTLPGVVTEIQITDKTATVEFSTDRDSELVVAIYPEEGIQLLGSGHAAVAAGSGTAEIAIEIDALPEYFVAAAYLLDAQTDEPLCEPYISRYYTQEFQDFLATDVTDYDPALVLNLDERTDTNFVVFQDGVLTARAGETANQVTDNGDGTYTVANPDESFLALAAGDSFTFRQADGTLLIVVVQSTELRGGSLLVTEKPDAELTDVFEYVKIDTTNEGVDPIVDTSQMGAGVSLLSTGGMQPYAIDINASTESSFSFFVKEDYFTGSLKFSVKFEIKCYVSLSWAFFRFKSDWGMEFSGEFTYPIAKIAIPLAPIIIPTSLRDIVAGVDPYFICEAEIAIKVSGKLSATLGFEFDSDRDGITNLNSGPTFSYNLTFSGKVFIGVKINPHINILKKWNAGSEAKIGAEIKVEENRFGPEVSDSIEHTCDCPCFAGTIHGVINASCSLHLGKITDKKWTLLDIRIKLKDFYLRLIDGTFISDWGTCPNIRYKVSLTVADKEKNGHPVEGVTVTVTKPTDPDFMPFLYRTDDKGELSPFHLHNGEYKLLLQKDGVSKQQDLHIDNLPVSATLVFEGLYGPLYKEGISEDGLKWSWYERGTLIISGTGDMKDYAGTYITASIPNYNFGSSMRIKRILISDGVTRIGANAFKHLATLTDISIPDSVKSIGASAFDGCENLMTVTIPDSVKSIGNNAFSSCKSLTSVGIPYGVRQISASTFYCCTALTEVTIPNTVTDISDSAFDGCSRLSDVYYLGSESEWNRISIGNDNNALLNADLHFSGPCGNDLTWSITKAGLLHISGTGPMENYDSSSDTPWDVSKVTSVLIDPGVTSIGDYAFADCEKLESVDIPDSVSSIGEGAFSGCTSLTSVTIPDRVTSIGSYTFYNCTGLTGVWAPGLRRIGDYAFYNCDALSAFSLPSRVWEIGDYAFAGCSSLTSFPIPDSVTWIGEYAFWYCTGLTDITIPGSVTTLRRGAFCSCSSLQSVTIENGVTTVPDAAFCDCINLSSVTIPGSVAQIGDFAFSGCTSLTSIIIPYGVHTLWEYAFQDCTNLTSVTIGGSSLGTDIYPHAFSGCTSLTNVMMLEGVTKIHELAFYDCSSLADITLPDSLTSIGSNAFGYCTSLTSLTIPGSVTSFDSAFSNCTGLTNVIMLEGLTDIGAEAFSGCTCLSSVTIPHSVTSIGNYAFYGCNNLINITIPENVTSIGDGAFLYCSSLPSITIPNIVTSINDSVFYGCRSLMDITIPDNVTSIGDSAFAYCSNLTSITIPTSVTSIGERAFESSGLTSVTIPDNVTSIANGTFSDCSSLTSITIPTSVTSIGDYSFYNCSSLTGLEFTYNLVSIGEYAFANCSSLARIVIPDGVTAMGNYAFSNCTCLWSVRISGLSSIPSYAFQDCNNLACVEIRLDVFFVDPYAFSGCDHLTDVYYEGTEAGWQWIDFSYGNDALTNATIHFNTEFSAYPKAVAPAAEPFAGSTSLEEPEPIEEHEPVEEPEPITEPEPSTEPEPVEEPEPIEEPEPEAAAEPEQNAEAEEPAAADELTAADELAIAPVAVYLPVENNGSLAMFQGLAPGAAYVLLVTADASVPVSLEPENLLYIAQAYADGAGNLNLSYVPRVNVDGATVRVFGASDKNLKDAEIEVEQFSDGSFRVTVRYDGEELTEGTDYILILTETEDTVTVTVRGRDAYAGEKTVIGDKFPLSSAAAAATLTLAQSYLLLTVGETASVTAAVDPAAYARDLRWTVEDGACVTVDENGTVTALQPGTATVLASVEIGGLIYAARCRVDVAEESEQPLDEQLRVNGVRLTASTATVELFKTDYARVGVVLNLTQNMMTMSRVIEQTAAADSGAAIESARFADPAVHGMFMLRVADDRSLEIVPRNVTLLQGEANPKGIKSSYSSEVLVTVDGAEYSAGKLSMTVKKSLPTIKAKAVKLNSFLTDRQTLVFTGGTVTAAELDPAKSAPDWLLYLQDGRSVIYTGAHGAKKSGKLYLLAAVEGWAIMRPVTVSVSAAKTAPKLSFSPASLTLKPGTGDAAGTNVTVSPAQFRNLSLYPVTLENITEGSGKTLKTYALGTVLTCSFDGEVLTVAPGPELTDGKAHTFKLWLSVAGQKAAVTVKTLAAKSTVSLKLKTAGGIDLAVSQSPLTITASTTNFHTDQATFQITEIVKAKSPESVIDRFVIAQTAENVFRLTAESGLEAGAYTATVSADCGGIDVEKTVNFTVKQSVASKVKPSVTLKLSGKIDVLRPGSSVRITPTIKNWYLHTLSESDLVFYRKVNKKFVEITDPAEIPFTVSIEDGCFVLTRRSAINHKTESYAVGMRFDADETSVNTAKPAALSVTMGKAAILPSTKTLTLIRNDKNSRAVLRLTPTDSQLAIAENGVTLDAKGAKLFALRELGDGYYEIRYLGGVQTTTKAATVKLSVRLVGNQTAASNATVSIKINIA